MSKEKTHMFNALNRLIVDAQSRRTEGQAMVEYGLALGLVSIVAIAALAAIGTDVNTVFGRIRDALALALG
jgi:Flp pilus assembly pilin Flp